MLVKIFALLTLPDRLRASVTCKQWHQLAFNPRKMRIRINERNCLAMSRNVQAYEKYRNASVHLPRRTMWNRNSSFDEIRSTMAYIVKTALIETVVIIGERCSIKAFLNDHLLSMKLLTSVAIVESYGKDQCVIPISHPNLKSISLGDKEGWHNRGLSFKINCPNLIDLTISRNVEATGYQLQQLQSLEFVCNERDDLHILTNAKLSNLKHLCLKFDMARAELAVELSFNRMKNLIQLELCNTSNKYYVSVGEQTCREFSVLANLSKLTLSVILIDAKEFATALRNMVQLRELELMRCNFKPPTTESCHVKIEHVKDLLMDCNSENFSIMLAYFAKIKKLSVTNAKIDTFEQIGDSYPELEELRFVSKNSAKQNFGASRSFNHIRNLKQLKHLQLVGMDLDGIYWAACSDMKILKLQLERCRLRCTAAEQLVESMGRGLRQLFLDNCFLIPPRVDGFENKENWLDDLRRYLPQCRVSCKDCSVKYED